MANTVKYFIENSNELSEYTILFLLNTAGYRGQRISEPGKDNFDGIYYGNKPDTKAKIIIPQIDTDILWKDLLENKIDLSSVENKLPFDIVSACSSMLTDKVNSGSENLCDAHGRLIFENSYQFKNGVGDFPPVNRYVKFLKGLIEKKFSIKGLPLWPEGKKCCIGLSHDVDRPIKYQVLRNFHFNKNWGLKEKAYHAVRFFHNYRKYIFDRNKSEFWVFDEIMKDESKYGFKSTFFICSANGYVDYGSAYDVFYDAGWKEFKYAYESIAANGFETGLHSSYNAYKNKENFIKEKERLEHLSGSEAAGLRNHYWHIGNQPEETLLMHEESGFKYDSSVSFNDHIGFRRNIAYPYCPYSSRLKRKINCMQLPVFCMDSMLFRQANTEEERINKIMKYVNIIKENEGLGIIDWHQETSSPANKSYGEMGKTYSKLLEKLSEDSDIWVTSLVNINSWIKDRERIING